MVFMGPGFVDYEVEFRERRCSIKPAKAGSRFVGSCHTDIDIN